MIKEILDNSTCAKCRICCSFVEDDAWETPVFTSTKIDYNKSWFKCIGNGSHTLKLSFADEKEIKLCPYLDENVGCTLNEDDKPIDCKMWPLRVMRKEDNIYLTLAPFCKGLSSKDISEVKRLLDNGLRQRIREVIVDDLVKEYDESYIIIEKL